MSAIERLTARFKSWTGYCEKKSREYLDDFTRNAGSGNYTCFGRDFTKLVNDGYDWNGEPWCDEYVDMNYVYEFGEDAARKLLGGFSAYTPASAQYFKNMGRWHTSNPREGDVIFFKNSSGICHTGYVTGCDGVYVYTNEGNTSSGSTLVANGGCVANKSYSLSYSRIAGYGRPDYSIVESSHYGEEFYTKLKSAGLVSDSAWQDYDAPTTKSQAVALIDKVTGGRWESEEADASVHWVQPHVISLCGKKIVTDKDQWLTYPDIPISKALLLALIDNATGGMTDTYNGRKTDHWGRNHLDSLCDKAIITTPEAWTDFEAQVSHAQTMALMAKAFLNT